MFCDLQAKKRVCLQWLYTVRVQLFGAKTICEVLLNIFFVCCPVFPFTLIDIMCIEIKLKCIMRCTWIEKISATIVKIIVCIPIVSLWSPPSDTYFASTSMFTQLLICKYSLLTKKGILLPNPPPSTRDWVVSKHFQTLIKSQILVIALECLSHRTDRPVAFVTLRPSDLQMINTTPPHMS